MPYIQHQGANIYWDEQGSGEPLLLLMGLAYPSDMWYRTRPVLAKNYRTIAIDNRGIGRSDVPPGPYPISLMSSDALAVLEAVGVESSHVYGISMGGMIAQELTLQHPTRVRSLILGCTAAGGPTAIQAEPEVRHMLMGRGAMAPEEAAQAAIPFIYHPGTPRARIDEDLNVRRPWFARPEAYVAQLQGILAWVAYDRLPQITAPTLVIHGENDRLVPAANGALIAGRIPGARLVTLPDAGHIYPTDQTEASHRAISDFLAAQNRTAQ